MSDPVHIVGGGVAGLATGLALARMGRRVTVHERAERIAEVGAGLQISPNGMAVLSALGVAGAVESVSLRSEAVRLIDGPTGRDVARLPLPDGFRLVHRAALIGALLDGARTAGVTVRTGAAIDRRRVAEFAKEGIVVAADGLRSAIRRRLSVDEEPRFTGQVAWRAIVEDDAAPEAQVWMGPGRHLVSYPLTGGRRNIVGVVETETWKAEGWRHEGDPAELRRAFSTFAGPVARWLDKVETVHVWGLFLHDVAEQWSDGERVVLAGDAAHPMLPFLAQGANMALEDAWVLARALAEHAPPEAFAAFERARKPRVARVVRAAERNTLPYHVSHPLTRKVVHGAIRLAGARALRRFDWLYGYDVTRA